MTVNPAAFYIAAAIVVAAAGAAVLLPRLRHAGVASSVMGLAVAALFAVSGAYAIAATELVVSAAIAALWAATLVKREPYCRIAPSTPPRSRNHWPAAGAAAALLALLLATFALASDRWHHGSLAPTRLITLLHYRAPYALIVAVVLVLVAAASALVLGRESGDERRLDHAAEQRRHREAREQRRRADREAARRSRRAAPGSSA